MLNTILFDNEATRRQLLPFTFTRPIADNRIGILTIREKWEMHLNTKVSIATEPYLQEKFPLQINDDNIFINGSIIPNKNLVEAIKNLLPNQQLVNNNQLIAARCNKEKAVNFFSAVFDKVAYQEDIFSIEQLWQIFSKNAAAFKLDFELLTKEKESASLNNSNTVIGNGRIFLEQGAVVNASILNTSTGDIYIGKDAEVMEGCMIRGPFALGEYSTLKMGAKIYGATTIGPHSKVGGEVNNSVIFGYSNKAHDGFLGNSVIGEWCNLGADTNNSNLKNNYAEVKLWNYETENFTNTGLQFCGLFMGDHSKCGINTMFNTGTVVGVSSNIFGAGFPRNFIPSFSWGGAQGITTFQTDKAFEVAERVLERRQLQLSEIDKNILLHVFKQEEKFRK